MLKNISKERSLKAQESKELEDNMDFTWSDHYSERIKFHMKMLNYYLKEEKCLDGSYH